MSKPDRLLRIPLALLAVFCFVYTANAADTFLDSAQIKTLVTGSTVDAHHEYKDFSFKIYFDTKGKAFRKDDNEIVETTYTITDGNEHCIQWKGSNRCARIKDNGDGTYYRVLKNGKELIKWSNLRKGMDL